MTTGARRALRLACVAVAAMLASIVAPSAAQAHETVDVTVKSNGAGVVSITVVWSDGHAVSERLNAIMVATSADGDRVGPVPLQVVPGHADQARYARALAAGRWNVTIDVAAPAVGHCAADIRVAAKGEVAKPSTKVCKADHGHGDNDAHEATTPAAAPTSAPPTSATPPLGVFTSGAADSSAPGAAPASSGSTTPWLIAGAALALAAIGGFVLVRRRAARSTGTEA